MSDLQAYLDQALKQVKIDTTDREPSFEDYDIEKELRQLITSTRNTLGITQKQLAERSGVSQANISKIENGSYHPSLAILKRIADGMGKRLVINFVDRKEIV